MALTREEIDAEASQILQGREATPTARAIIIAWLEHKSGLPIDQHCQHCGEQLHVQGRKGSWLVSCPCGKTVDTLRGL